MKTLHAFAERVIAAPPAPLYAIVADYEDSHPRILPPPYLSNLRVEKGGYGDGTVITCEMRAMGRSLPFRAHVTEPEPGRVLQEAILESGLVTTFTFEPVGGGQRTRVRIDTRWPAPWWRARVEQALMGRLLRKVYDAELQNLSYEVSRAHAEAA